ncbi:hypothetical protein IAD21_05519 [Abditibacteriota bacterium]|nr:hypothetical protein IAD21_05519 [Abditibacteriota bacterium]
MGMKHSYNPRTRWLLGVSLVMLLGGSICCGRPSRAQAPAAQAPAQTPWMALIAADNSFNFAFYKDLKPVLNLGIVGWGPNWAWKGLSANQRAQGDELNASTVFESNKEAGEIINVALKARAKGPNSVSFQYTLSADKDVPLTQLVATLSTDKEQQEGEAIVTQADETQVTLPLSLGGMRELPEASAIAFQTKGVGRYDLKLDPPVTLRMENGLRIVLAKEKFPAGTKTVTLTLTFPQSAAFLATDADLARFTKTLPGPDWFPFTPSNDVGPSAIGFEDWLDKPAGKHGGVRMEGDHFQFEDKTPIKFWGTNLAYASSAPEKKDAEFMAARFAKWGVNAVRMHKFTGSGWEGIGDANDATKMDATGLDRLDYFSSQLAKNGVYYGWSHTYHFRPKAGNRARLLAPDEIETNLKGDTYGLINIAPDVQDLLIETVVNLLKHPNPYTGKTYAQDPALAYVEMHNEDDVFFYNTQGALDAAPSYKKKLMERWSAWLQQKYSTQDALKTAWGDALSGDETLAAKSIGIQANPWFFGEDNLPKKTGGERQRLLDNAAFLHSEQNDFYQKFARAIRDTGYQGPLIGSPWQAPAMLPHLYNLRSDSMVGYVDRHNYFGGGLFDTMLKEPGGGYLSSGLQQVEGKPFGLSEWIHVYPSLYSAEGPAIAAAYGMGLQGWDASYEFQSAGGGSAFSSIAGNFPWGVWNADVPSQIGQYPLLARMIARGDVPQGDVISVRRVSPDNLTAGNFNFSDRVTQSGDIKNFGGSVPEAALAAGRCLVEFTDKPQTSTFPDMSHYQKAGSIQANNGALNWDATGQGYFTVNTAGTKAVVGFAQDKEFKLGSIQVKLGCPYASLFITSTEQKADLSRAKSALISAVARNANSGFSYFVPDNRVIENGKAPILMEPVKATIAFGNRPVKVVNVLDQDGKRTGRTLPVSKGQFVLDEAQDKTLWYEVVFGD